MAPAVFEVGANREGSLFYEESLYKYSAAIELALKAGLSRKGWLWMVNKLGRPAVRAFAEMIGPEMAATLSGWGIFVLIGVGGALVMSYLTAWAVESAWDRAKLEAAVTWYVSAYVRPLFHDERTEAPYTQRGSELVRKMVELGEQDLIADMKHQLIEAPPLNPVPYNAEDRNFWRPAYQALYTYRRYLAASCEGSEETAEWRVINQLNSKARQVLGI